MCFDLIVTSKSLLALTRAVNIYICCRAQLGMHMYLRTHVTAQVRMHGCNCYFAFKKITQDFFVIMAKTPQGGEVARRIWLRAQNLISNTKKSDKNSVGFAESFKLSIAFKR